jgi:hypothetical protein
MPATLAAPLEKATVCHRARTKFARASRRGLFDRSDQINQNSRGVVISPRGTGQTRQRAISLRCRKIRQRPPLVRWSCQTCSLCATLLLLNTAFRRSGGARRDRTDDLMLAKHALSQLSYGPISEACQRRLVGPGRLELPTSRLSGVRSNHLSYGPSGSRQRAGS